MVGYLAFLPIRSLPDVATFVLVACGLLALFSRAPLRPRLGRSDYAVIAVLITACVLSTLLSTDPGPGARFLVFLLLNLFLMLLAAAMRSQASVRIIAWCLATIGIIHLAALLWGQAVTSAQAPGAIIESLAFATLIVPNDALILGLCLPSLAVALLLTPGAGRRRISWVAVLAYGTLSAYASYLLRSKVAFLCIVSALLAMAAVRLGPKHDSWFPQRRWALISGVAASLLIVSASAFYLGNKSTTRLTLWNASLTHHSTPAEVLFGAGPNSFVFDPRFENSPFDLGDHVIPWVHNAYLEAYYDQGLVGLSGFLALTVLPILRATKIVDRDVRLLLMGSIIAFCVAAWFEITLTRRFCFAFLMIMYGLSCAHARRAPA